MAVYLVFGAVWILLSDQLVAVVADPDPTSTLAQSVKGILYVLGSGGLIFLLLRVRERQLDESRRIIGTMSQESQVLQRILRHNIRNDLNIITGHIETIENQTQDEAIIERLEAAQESATDLLSITEKVRAVEGIQLTDTVREPVDIVGVLDRTVTQIESEHPGVSIERDVPERAWVKAGPALRYAITELLENSIKHFDGDLHDLRIVASIETPANVVRLSIEDNGPGIPEHERASVVERRETPLEHGSGIGLWLVAWVIDLYRGDLSISAESDAGSTVTCTLPETRPPDE